MITKPAKVTFTKRSILALKPPVVGKLYVYDLGQANLALCVTANDVRTFYRTGRGVDGKAERIKIGRFPDTSIENARKRAREMSGDIAKGVNPKQKRDKAGTIEALFKHWLAHAKLRKKSWQADQDNFDLHFGPLADRRFASLSSADVAKWHTAIGTKRGTYIANRCRALLSAMYGSAHLLGYTGPNPCLHVDRFQEHSRERFLLPDEMTPFFAALKAEPPAWRDFWLLCLFTGARRGNVAMMAWKDLDLGQGIWYVAGVKLKNGLPLAIVLPGPAAALLQARAKERNGSAYVFPSGSDAGYIKDPRKSWARVCKAAGVENLRPHDLRRSLGSWQALAGSSLQIIGQSLGHRDVKSTAVYARLLMDPVRTSVNGAVQAMITASDLPPADKPAKPVRKTKKGSRKNGKA